MANVGPTAWYIRDNGTVGYSAVTAWSAAASISAGALRRPTAASLGNERVVAAIVGGTTGGSQPTWTTTKGAKNTDNTVTWQEVTGQPGVNGDAPASITTNASTASGSNVLTFASTSNARIGMLVSHANLPTGSSSVTVIAVGATTVTLSGNATGTIASGQVVWFGYCPAWLNNKNTNVSLGLIIFDTTTASLQIVSTAGTVGNSSQPSFSATAGTATSDNTVTWTSLGLASGFSAWSAPHARLGNAYTANWGLDNDTFWLTDDHAETQSVTNIIAAPGTIARPNSVYSINHAASLPPGSSSLLVGASITTTSTSNMFTTGSVYYYGVSFSAGSGAVTHSLTLANTSASWQRLDSCKLKKAGTSGASGAIAHGANSRLDLINTTVEFGATSDNISLSGGVFTWRNTPNAIVGANLPTTLLSNTSSASAGNNIIEGVDFSVLGSGKTLIGAGNTQTTNYLINCTFGASVTVAATPTSPGGAKTYVVCSDSAGTNYVQGIYAYEGTLTQETTIIRTGGATDGTTPLAWKIVTTANSKWILPFECFPISIWNDVITPTVRTVTVYGIWGGSAVPNSDDIWIDVEYLGASGSPLASLATSTKSNNLTTGSALSTDSSTWGGSTTKFKMTATFTAQLAGYIRIYVKAGAASSTFYIDPRPNLS